jgi:proline-specific peptidase
MGSPAGVERVVPPSTSASMPQFSAETVRLKAELPADVQAVLAHHESIGDYQAPAYLQAVEVFYARYVCRLDQWPDCLLRTVANLDHNQVYEVMNGPNEFTTIGNLRDWDRTAQLDRITVPTLITCGRYDELGPTCAATIQAGVPHSELVIFEHSAHCAHLEEPERYRQVVGDFLRAGDTWPSGR